jgi:cytochrome c556
MLKSYSKIYCSILAIILSIGTVIAEEDTRTPEEKAYQFRDGLFHVIEYKFGKMIEAKFAGDKATFHKIAAEISYMSNMIPEGFIPNSIVEGTQAKEEIWEDWDKFTKKAAGFTDNLNGLADPGYDISAFDPKKFGGDNCGSCHRKFKSREKFKP